MRFEDGNETLKGKRALVGLDRAKTEEKIKMKRKRKNLDWYLTLPLLVVRRRYFNFYRAPPTNLTMPFVRQRGAEKTSRTSGSDYHYLPTRPKPPGIARAFPGYTRV